MGDPNVVEYAMPFGDDPVAEEAAQYQVVEQAKADLAEEVTAAEEPEGPPPELAGILEKYGNDPVKLAAAYKALQQEFGRVKQGQAPTPEATPPAEAEVSVPEMPAPEVIAQLKEGLFDAAGGPEQFQAIQAWVMENIPPGRVAAYNAALQGGNVEAALTAFKAMQYDYIRNVGYEGKLIGGRAPRGGDVVGFASEGEMTAAMSDPRYSPSSGKYDEAYHRQVIRRLAVTS